jgi:hypothetical protein
MRTLDEIQMKVYLDFNRYGCSLKVESSENKGGSKVVPIIRYWSQTMALGSILPF